MQEEITLPKHERGLVSLLRDHLLDLDLFMKDPVEGYIDLESNSAGEGESETRQI
jgi:hypothetical protein